MTLPSPPTLHSYLLGSFVLLLGLLLPISRPLMRHVLPLLTSPKQPTPAT